MEQKHSQQISANDIQDSDIQWDASIPLDANSIPDDDIVWGDDDYSKMSWGSVLKKGAKNVPSSGYDYVKNFYTAITHPKDTFNSVKTLAKGIFKTGALRILADGMGIDYESLDRSKDKEIAATEAIEKAILERYGTEDGFKKAVAEDPVGVWADIATVAVPAAKTMGATKAASYMEPISAATKLGSKAFKLIPEELPSKLYQSAVKFNTTLPMDKRAAVAKTAIATENQIMPTVKGLRKLRDKIDDLNNQVMSRVDAATSSGAVIDTDKLLTGIDQLKNTMKATSDEPLKVEAAYKTLKKNIDEAVNISGSRTPEQVQKMKQKIYKELAGFYEQHKAAPARVELRKKVAKNARELIEQAVPGIKSLNQKEGALIELWDALEQKASRISNRDLIGIGLPVKMGTGSGIGFLVGGETGGAVGASLGLVLGVIETPQVKSKLAIILNQLREKGITVNNNVSEALLGSSQSGRANEAMTEIGM